MLEGERVCWPGTGIMAAPGSLPNLFETSCPATFHQQRSSSSIGPNHSMFCMLPDNVQACRPQDARNAKLANIHGFSVEVCAPRATGGCDCVSARVLTSKCRQGSLLAHVRKPHPRSMQSVRFRASRWAEGAVCPMPILLHPVPPTSAGSEKPTRGSRLDDTPRCRAILPDRGCSAVCAA